MESKRKPWFKLAEKIPLRKLKAIRGKSFVILVSALILLGLSIFSAIEYVNATSGNITQSTSVSTRFGEVTITSVQGSTTVFITQTDAVVLQPEVTWINGTSTTSVSDGTASDTSTTTTTVTLTTVTCGTGGIC